MYFPAEHFLDKLQISAEQLSDFEQRGIVKGVARAGRVFYSSRDMYRLKGILLFMTRGLTLDEAQRRVDHPTEESSAVTSVAKAGSRIDSLDSDGNLPSVQRKHPMSTDGMDPIRLRQVRAIAENLCTQANRHRDNNNYLVAHALYGRALCVAQQIRSPEHDTDSLVARIRTDQQAVFEMLRSGESGLEKPLEKAQKVGR